MGVGFDAPQALLLLVPALLLTVGLHLASRRRIGLGRRRLALLLRAVVLACLVLALAGFRLVLPVDRLATVYVVDLSDSVGTAGREDALAWLRESIKVMPEGDVASSPTTPRNGSSCCPMATTRPARARARQPLPPRAGSRSRRGRSGSGRPTRSSSSA